LELIEWSLVSLDRRAVEVRIRPFSPRCSHFGPLPFFLFSLFFSGSAFRPLARMPLHCTAVCAASVRCSLTLAACHRSAPYCTALHSPPPPLRPSSLPLPRSTMPLIYSLVSRSIHVLAEYTASGLTGNFSTVSRVLLKVATHGRTNSGQRHATSGGAGSGATSHRPCRFSLAHVSARMSAWWLVVIDRKFPSRITSARTSTISQSARTDSELRVAPPTVRRSAVR